jgi:hypothetical protein
MDEALVHRLLDGVPEMADKLGISRSQARMMVATGRICACGVDCWRVGGEKGCIYLHDPNGTDDDA